MFPSEYYIESSTLFDDQYLSYHDLIENKSETGESIESRPHLSAGGYSYTLKNDHRFIIWRVNGNQLELVEQSLVYKLSDNCKRIHFKNAMIIPRVFVHMEETSNPNIQVLVATTSKLYRFIFNINLNDFHTKSVFHGFSASNLSNIEPWNSFTINLQQVDKTDLTIARNGDALFGFVLSNHSLICIQMISPNKQNVNSPLLPTRYELNQPNIVKRLWSGITRNIQDTQSQIISFKFFSLNNSNFLIGLCKDFKLKVWCLKSAQCVFIDEIGKYLQIDSSIFWDESMIEINSSAGLAILTLVLRSSNEFKVCNFKLDSNHNSIHMTLYSNKSICKNGKLMSIKSDGTKVWLMYRNEHENIEIIGMYIDPKNPSIVYLEESSLKNERFTPRNDDEDLDEDLMTIDMSTGDVKEAFLKLIFEPYRFSSSNICKALGILRSSEEFKSGSKKSDEELKEILIESIECEVHSHPNVANCTEEDFLYLNSKCWSKFYTMLKQYDYDSRLPIGFHFDSHNESMFMLIRKNSLSLFSFMDISQINKQSQMESVKFYLKENGLDENLLNIQGKDLLSLCMAVNVINLGSRFIQSDSSNDFNPVVSTAQSINSLIDVLLKSDEINVLAEISNNLNQINGLVQTIELVVDIFERELANHEIDRMEEESSFAIGGQTLNSEFTVNSFIAGFYHLVEKRFQFLKGLTILTLVLQRLYEKFGILREITLEISRRYSEPLIQLLNGYEYLKWLSAIRPIHVSNQDLEKNRKRVYDLADGFAEDSSIFLNQNQLLLKLFLLDVKNRSLFDLNALSQSIHLFKFDQINSYFLCKSLKLAWPSNLNESTSILKYLMINAQYVHIDNYCQMTKWSKEGKHLRYFLLANSCLFFNDISKSIDLFLRASLNINDDRILKNFIKIQTSVLPNDAKRKKMTINSNNSSYIQNMSTLLNDQIDNYELEIDEKVLLNYYTKVIHYYELNENFEAEIELVQNALVISRFDTHSRSKLYCILFKSYMTLEYYEQAHAAIVQLEPEWKLTCLKHFISELCNQNKTAKLISFDYGDMLQDVLKILYERAIKSDLRTHDYYGIIYSLHIKQKDYLKAASCMYECGMRLRRELNGINSLKRQEKCFLASLNVLKLMDEKFAWIVRYNEKPEASTYEKHSGHNLNLFDLKSVKKNNELNDLNLDVKIVDINEINKCFLLTSNVIKLSSMIENQSNVNNHFLMEEIVGMLIKYGYFDDAVIMLNCFKGNSSTRISNVLMGLVDRCCVDEEKEVDTGKFISDLQSEYDFLKNNDSLSISQLAYEHPSVFKWKLLELYLTKYNNPVYYKLVCERLLKNCFELPEFVVESFKKLDPNCLLQVYIDYNCWNDAIQLVNEQMNLVLDDNRLKDWITTNKICTVHLPYSSIDKILYALTKSGEKEMMQKGNELKKRVSECIDQLKSVTDSIKTTRKNQISNDFIQKL